MKLIEYYNVRKEVALYLRKFGWNSFEIFFFLRYGRLAHKIKSNPLIRYFRFNRRLFEEPLWQAWYKYERDTKNKLFQSEQAESIRQDEFWNQSLSAKTRVKVSKKDNTKWNPYKVLDKRNQ